MSVDDADPWSLTEPYEKKINIYGSPDKFERGFATAPIEIGHLFAAKWCHDEVCNGGFHQFFSNSTGVLAPEALGAFKALKLKRAAKLLEQAMSFFGKKYPRDARTRQAKLSRLSGDEREEWDPFYRLDDKYYQLTAEYDNASTAYAKAYVQKRDAKPATAAVEKRTTRKATRPQPKKGSGRKNSRQA